MQEEHSRKSRRVRFLLWMQVAGVAVAVPLLFLLLKPSGDASYQFMAMIDHPIEVMADKSGRWFYYGQGRMNGTSAQIAAVVRRELLPLGFTEDTTSTPWFRFVKGNREVIVCNHDEIAATPFLTNASEAKVFHETCVRTPQSVLWPVVWVHQPGSDMAGVVGFQLKKVALRW